MNLTGKRILVTRSVEQAGEMAALVRRAGGIPVLFPTIRLTHPENCAPLDREIGRLSSFDWILFTSANAARFFCERAARLGVGSWPGSLRVASVGPGTTKVLAERSVPVHRTAGKHTAEGLFEALHPEGIRGKRFLLPRAEEGREILPDAIAGEGGEVVSVVAYRNGLAEKDEEIAREIVSRPPDVCTFASPSAFRNLFLLLGNVAARNMLSRTRIAVIGEVTARAVERRDFRVDIVPETYTLKGMVDAIQAFFAAHRSAGPG
ncbi:MAG TPA: uroporphyrinogen-III synthase [Candidatus Deferrimicrobium sp.]|nr:uroporphyrinogen-III synthase [Candidatus Deferrimicrobium sp.]